MDPVDFGLEMARLRARRGWSVRELARRANVSAGQIGNLESGRRDPTPAVAAACDAALGAGGALIESAETARRGACADQPVEVGDLVAGYEQILESVKNVGRSTGPRFVAASLRANMRTLADAGTRTAGRRRSEVWLLASRFAEYTGWMAQEAGKLAEAVRWTDLAARWGADGGDETAAAYALVRKAFIAEHRGDLDAAIRLAVQAGGHPAATPLICAHAAQREAQAYARRGDGKASRDALERSQGHADAGTADATPQWGPRVENRNSGLIEAACLLRLCDFEAAAGLFSSGWESSKAAFDGNSQTRVSLRAATALAGLGRLDEACHVIEEVLPMVRCLDSATIRLELGCFVRQARSARATAGQFGLVEAAAAASDARV